MWPPVNKPTHIIKQSFSGSFRRPQNTPTIRGGFFTVWRWWKCSKVCQEGPHLHGCNGIWYGMLLPPDDIPGMQHKRSSGSLWPPYSHLPCYGEVLLLCTHTVQYCALDMRFDKSTVQLRLRTGEINLFILNTSLSRLIYVLLLISEKTLIRPHESCWAYLKTTWISYEIFPIECILSWPMTHVLSLRLTG